MKTRFTPFCALPTLVGRRPNGEWESFGFAFFKRQGFECHGILILRHSSRIAWTSTTHAENTQQNVIAS